MSSSLASCSYNLLRIGHGGKVFKVWKLRTMVPDAHRERATLLDRSDRDGLMFKMRHDPRMTPVGRFLRRTSIDELPQLYNVLRGDMSVVGPRPHALSAKAGILQYDEIVGDYASLGLTLRRHPLALLRARLAKRRIRSAEEVAEGFIANAAGLPRYPGNDAACSKLAAAWLIEAAGFRKGERRGNVAMFRSTEDALLQTAKRLGAGSGGSTAASVAPLVATSADEAERLRRLPAPVEEALPKTENREKIKYALMWADHTWVNYFPYPYDGPPSRIESMMGLSVAAISLI